MVKSKETKDVRKYKELKKKLCELAEIGDYRTAKKELTKNKKLLKELYEREGRLGMIEHFYEPYCIAFDKHDKSFREFTIQYQICLDKLLGITKPTECCLFTEDEYI
jgi:hypothetical protein